MGFNLLSNYVITNINILNCCYLISFTIIIFFYLLKNKSLKSATLTSTIFLALSTSYEANKFLLIENGNVSFSKYYIFFLTL